MYNHVIGVRAEEGQQKKKEVCIQTEEQRSRSFIRGKRESQVEIAKRGRGGRRSAGGRGRDAGRRPLRFDRGSRIRPIVGAIVDRHCRNKSVARRSKIGLKQIRFAGPFRSSGTVLRSRGVRLRWSIPGLCRSARYIVILHC